MDKAETAERGGGRPLPVGLPDAVGGGDGGRDAPPHPVAVPKGDFVDAKYMDGLILNTWNVTPA